MAKILVIDDEQGIRSALKEILENEKYIVEDAADGPSALKKIKEDKFDVVLCDIKMPQMDGIEVLKEMMKISDTPVIMISSNDNIDIAIESMKLGAFDYIQKPPNLNKVLSTIKNAIGKSKLISDDKRVKRKTISKKYDMIGNSAAINHIKEIIEKVAHTEARVLITGANGTGKELVAHWLHEKSHRSNGAFIEVNCAAIPSELIESTLFGHKKGSFTGAINDRIGDFENANGGTIFLDEIGDMSLAAQAKVLRALQESKITRIGESKEIPVNVRVLAATNKDLKAEIAKNNFREDLYHRLSVILIKVPSLSERIEDIPDLANHFIEKFCTEGNIPIKTLSSSAIKELQKQKWTGNIRELMNVINRMVILCGDSITDKDVKLYCQSIDN